MDEVFDKCADTLPEVRNTICDVVLCYVILCYLTCCGVVLCDMMFCVAISCETMNCHKLVWDTIWCRTIRCDILYLLILRVMWLCGSSRAFNDVPPFNVIQCSGGPGQSLLREPDS